MMEYANTLMRVGEHEFDHEELKEQIKEAEKIIFQGEGKANYIYNETRLSIEALENEYVALYVSKRYFQKAMIKGNKEAEQKYLLIEKNHNNYNDHPLYFDDLFVSLHT
ncbi:hypothetical protein M9Y10_019482 [Tritrichomonas musculus]|uniref:Uncharacterized protein n=1 Tax=Tritrichomonas musculus TaxID=1915356 RepID=A0ABR2HGG1_9EUKA